ncbi:hypothetical protein [Actinoplanes sp. NPDC049681]
MSELEFHMSAGALLVASPGGAGKLRHYAKEPVRLILVHGGGPVGPG